MTSHGQWSRCTAKVYSFPVLHPRSELSEVGSGCLMIRADSEGRVFAGCKNRVVMLEISEAGNLTFSRNLTAGGRLRGITGVSVGPKPGQLWLGSIWAHPKDKTGYLIDVDNDSVIQEIQAPVVSNNSSHLLLSQLQTGELLMTEKRHSRNNHLFKEDWTVRLYQSGVTLPPKNLTVTGHVLLSHRDHFLLQDIHANTILILNSHATWFTQWTT